jgi:hypothetical protein
MSEVRRAPLGFGRSASDPFGISGPGRNAHRGTHAIHGHTPSIPCFLRLMLGAEMIDGTMIPGSMGTVCSTLLNV